MRECDSENGVISSTTKKAVAIQQSLPLFYRDTLDYLIFTIAFPH